MGDEICKTFITSRGGEFNRPDKKSNGEGGQREFGPVESRGPAWGLGDESTESRTAPE